jgi:hypothetical protein
MAEVNECGCDGISDVTCTVLDPASVECNIDYGNGTSETMSGYIVPGGLIDSALAGTPEGSERGLKVETLFRMIERLKAENAELLRIFSDRVQDSDIAARAVEEMKRKMLAVVLAEAKRIRSRAEDDEAIFGITGWNLCQAEAAALENVAKALETIK